MKLFCAFVFSTLLLSCGQNDRVKLHADSIAKQLIILPVSEKQLRDLVDSSKWVFKAELVEPGVFWNWDFGMSEATHHFRIDSSYIGNEKGFAEVRQKLSDYTLNKKRDYFNQPVYKGDEFILFLKSQWIPPPPQKFAAPFSADSISFVDKYPGAKIYELTTDSIGMMLWSADIEIRLNQILKEKH